MIFRTVLTTLFLTLCLGMDAQTKEVCPLFFSCAFVNYSTKIKLLFRHIKLY